MSQVASRLLSIRELKAESPIGFGVFMLLGALAFAFAFHDALPGIIRLAPPPHEIAAEDRMASDAAAVLEEERESLRMRAPASSSGDETSDEPLATPAPSPQGEASTSVDPLDEVVVTGSALPETGLVAGMLNGIDGPQLAVVFCLGAALISGLVLFVSLPVYLFANSTARTRRAGGLVRTTLGFFVTSAAGLLGTISFAGRAAS